PAAASGRSGGGGAEGGSGGGGAGGGSTQGPGEPIVLTGEATKRATKPAERTSYRRRKKTAEERRLERTAVQAELNALSRSERDRAIEEPEVEQNAPGGRRRPASAPPRRLRAGSRIALVDGYNVINTCPQLLQLAGFRLQARRGRGRSKSWPESLAPALAWPDARAALDQLANAYGAMYGFRVYVVYDAMYGPLRQVQDSLVRVGPHAAAIFSARSEADTYIGVAAVHWKQRGAEEVMVISNDRYVQDLVRDADFVVYSADLGAWLAQAYVAAANGQQGLGRGGRGASTLAAAEARDLHRAAVRREHKVPKAQPEQGPELPASEWLAAALARMAEEASSSGSDDDGEAWWEEGPAQAAGGGAGELRLGRAGAASERVAGGGTGADG
ncbi:hypothetical protein TSOC_003219, partial [Tetrabaena socialis]